MYGNVLQVQAVLHTTHPAVAVSLQTSLQQYMCATYKLHNTLAMIHR